MSSERMATTTHANRDHFTSSGYNRWVQCSKMLKKSKTLYWFYKAKETSKLASTGENKWKTIMVGWKVKTVYNSGNFWHNGWIKDYWETSNGQEMWQDNQRHHLCARGNASDAYHKSFIWLPENIWSLIIFNVLACCTILPLRSCHQKIQEYKIIHTPNLLSTYRTDKFK